MLKIGLFYHNGKEYFKTCSFFPTHLPAQEQTLLCERFSVELSQTFQMPHIICRTINTSKRVVVLSDDSTEKQGIYEDCENTKELFLLPLSDVKDMVPIATKCDACLYFRETLHTFPQPHCIHACGLRIPRPLTLDSECVGFRPLSHPYDISRLDFGTVQSLLHDLFIGCNLIETSITAKQKKMYRHGCMGGHLNAEEFKHFFCDYPTQTIYIIKDYWDLEQNKINFTANGFAISSLEFDYAFYKYYCDTMYTLYHFPKSKETVISHCEEIYVLSSASI